MALGKNVGDDLAEGKPTLPLLHAMRHGNAPTAALIRERLSKVVNVKQLMKY